MTQADTWIRLAVETSGGLTLLPAPPDPPVSRVLPVARGRFAALYRPLEI